MKLFYCDHCGHAVFFENVECLNCGHTLGFLPDKLALSALEPVEENRWRSLIPDAQGQHYKMCENYAEAQACNWMLPAEEPETFCCACRLNRTIPDLSKPDNVACWQRLEAAKRRLVYSLISLRLPFCSKTDDPEHGLAFDLLADPDPEFGENEDNKVMTGHAEGLITINIGEADDAVREKNRLDMKERYRTVLGHFRHEIGHYYWEQLIRNSAWLSPCRDLFGDEREDYGQALQRHYENGPPADWQNQFISTYATSHPWEDWAETWSHYLHMTDTLETASAFGLKADPPAPAIKPQAQETNPHVFDNLIARWMPLTFALNSINRSMGQKDLYPFVLAPPVIDKLHFVHRVIERARDEQTL